MDDVRLPEFAADDGDDARTRGRRSAQSGRVEFITRGDRRRMWAVEQKRRIALESMDPSTTPTDVARRYGISSGLLYTWRRQMLEGQLGSAPQPMAGFARVDLVEDLPRLAAPASALEGVGIGIVNPAAVDGFELRGLVLRPF